MSIPKLPFTSLITVIAIAAAGCAIPVKDSLLRIEAVSRGAIRPVNIRVETFGDGAVVRGSVIAGPGYRSWQRSHLVIEIVSPDHNTAFSRAVAFTPQPIPRIVRSRGRSHFSLVLPAFPKPGSLVRITPHSGPLPSLSPFS
jgi:hypothetical protein